MSAGEMKSKKTVTEVDNKQTITAMDEYLFGHGRHYEIYQKMGSHVMKQNGKKGVYFTVWAPNAKAISVVGDFCDWDAKKHPMTKRVDSDIWELFIPGVKVGDIYKYAITTSRDEVILKADPYGNQCQMRPDNASVVADIDHFKWSDGVWQKKKEKVQGYDQPVSIYEVHLGSWKKGDKDVNSGFKTYRELAPELAEYVKYMGYTHVEFIGIAEHPFDGSWGYQVSGYYAPTSRHGKPEDFMYLVNYLHKEGIGVILDWVPAHFPKDAHCIGRFDGDAVYEHADPRRGEHPEWGTYVFNYARPQVLNFLVANACYWLEKFHVDGLRVDAVASMLYLDYGKKDGQWIANDEGTNINKESVEFLKHLNSILKKRNPGAIMIAEESTAWPKVSKPAEDGGLGFTYKWNMGWMHDFLNYMKVDPYFRQYHHGELTFSFEYAFSENYILVLSHDEVVHLKCSMINKMPGDMKDKFGNLRTAYGFMTAHPGKKLLFMGQEFAQLREWSEERSLDWYLLDNEKEHRQLNDYYRDLLAFYKNTKALYELDCDPEGFKWVFGGDTQHNMLTFARMTKSKKKCVLFHFNFSPVVYENHRIACPCPGTYTEIFNSDAEKYGGSGLLNPEPIKSDDIPWDWNNQSIQVNIPAYGMVALEFDYKEPPKKKAPAKKVPAKKAPAKKATAAKTVEEK